MYTMLLWTSLHKVTKYGLWISVHGVISLPDATSCDKSFFIRVHIAQIKASLFVDLMTL